MPALACWCRTPTTPGHVYELSNEHHSRVEIALNGCRTGSLCPPDRGRSRRKQEAISLQIQDSSHITIANWHAYRVTRTVRPIDTAARSSVPATSLPQCACECGKRLGTCDANGCATYLRASKFPRAENAIRDLTHHIDVREREFAVLNYPVSPPTPVIAGKVEKPGRRLLFHLRRRVMLMASSTLSDPTKQRIYGWSREAGLTNRTRQPHQSVKPGHRQARRRSGASALGAEGTLLQLKPGSPKQKMNVIRAHAQRGCIRARACSCRAIIGDNGEFKDQIDPRPIAYTNLPEMLARDMAAPKDQGVCLTRWQLFLPDFRTFRKGAPTDRLALRTRLDSNWLSRQAGQPRADQQRVRGPHLQRAGRRQWHGERPEGLRTIAAVESVAVGTNGNVYLANGQVLVYARMQAARDDRCAGAPATAVVRRRGWADVVHPHPCTRCTPPGFRPCRGDSRSFCTISSGEDRRLFDFQEGALDLVLWAAPARSSSR